MSANLKQNTYPKLHNAMWPGLVGKGSPGAEPCIDLDTMLDLTSKAEVDGIKFDGVDLFLFDPHVSIDVDDAGLKKLADKVQARGFVVGSVVAPVWPPTGGGSAMGSDAERKAFVGQVRKACRIAKRLRELGVRPEGVVRIDSASGVSDWAKDPKASQAKIAKTFREACAVAEDFGERLAAEGEICWGGMHSWKRMVDLLQRVNRPKTLGFQADMAHTLLYVLGYNAAEDAILPAEWDWSDPARLNRALKTLTDALRPWTIDFHVAQNDATVHGSGTHDKTGHHCLPNDPKGKLNIAEHAGYWLREPSGKLTKAIRHICWDGCMFSNAVMAKQDTWNDILKAMIVVRDAHGWSEAAKPKEKIAHSVTTRKPKQAVSRAKAKVVKKAKPAPAKKLAVRRLSAKAAPRHKVGKAKARRKPAVKAKNRLGRR
jgi:sugar phosphate isomerase/epimerase